MSFVLWPHCVLTCHGSYIVTFHTCLLPCECFHSHNQLCPMTTCVLFCQECHDMFMKIQFSFISSFISCVTWWRIRLFCCHFSIADAAVTIGRKTYRGTLRFMCGHLSWRHQRETKTKNVYPSIRLFVTPTWLTMTKEKKRNHHPEIFDVTYVFLPDSFVQALT